MIHNVRILIIICVAITESVLLSACHPSVNSVKKTDTTTVLQILLDSAFHKNRLATSAQLNPYDPLKDTTIFERNDILTRYLPKNFPHKLLTEEEMCELMSIHKITNLHFLELDDFVKISNGYRTALGTHCMWRGTSETEPMGTLHTVCEREKYCNAVLHMAIIRSGNNFIGSKFSMMTY